MKKRKDDIRTIIVVVCVCVICLVIGLILSHKSNYDNLSVVNEYSTFFTNINYVNNYISRIANNDSSSVYNLLDNKYIEENNITMNNVLDIVGNYSVLSSFDVNNMYYTQVDKDYIYYIEGKIYENGYDEEKNLINDKFALVIINDTDKSSYSLYPVNNNNQEKIINSIKKININKNKYNSIQKSESINKEQICLIYLSDFTDNILTDINNSYDLLSSDMKKIYNTTSKYIDYIGDNFDLITSTADKCKLEELEDKRKYTVIDTNGNTYIFTEEHIMNYKVDFYLKNSLS